MWYLIVVFLVFLLRFLLTLFLVVRPSYLLPSCFVGEAMVSFSPFGRLLASWSIALHYSRSLVVVVLIRVLK